MTKSDKNHDMQLETRALNDLRMGAEEGVFEGYIAVWDTVDAYESTFKRGSFSKTIDERADKVKVYYNHDELIGRSLDITEDDHGVFVRGRLTTNVQRSKDVLEFIRDGTLTGLSFGFQVLKEAFTEGVRQILEVKLFEYGPVDFPANDAAMITGHRAERIILDASATRAATFAQTLTDADLQSQGYRLMSALDRTLDHIWWSDRTPADVMSSVDDAIAEFHAAYVEWVAAFNARFNADSEARISPHRSDLAAVFAEFLAEDGRTLKELAESTAFTIDELTQLRRGELIDAREKLADLTPSIATAHRTLRTTAVESLCSNLRSGLTPAESRRLAALLAPALEQCEPEPDASTAITAHLRAFRNTLQRA